MERMILQGTAREVLKRLRDLLERRSDSGETVQVTVEPVSQSAPVPGDPIAVALQRGLSEANRGELIEHEKVLAWIESLGTERELPMPKMP